MKLNLYQPHANQITIHESKAKYRVVVAGRRFGKSALALNEAIARAMQLPNQIIWIILPLYRQAKEVYWIDPDVTKFFMPLVQAGICKADKSELSLHFHETNSWIRLKGSDNYDSLRGSGIDLLIWDEVADVKPEAFDTLEPSLADSPNHRVLFIGTPKGLNWFHDFAMKGDHKKSVTGFGKAIFPNPNWETWHFTSYDNLSWPEGSKERKAFVDYIDEKRSEAQEKGRMSFWNQEYMAAFEESGGRFFPVWAYNTHVIAEKIYPKQGLAIEESIDWGRSAPFAWYAHVVTPVEFEVEGEFVTFNRVFTFAELYGSGLSPGEWTKRITETRQRFGYSEAKNIDVDPSMFNPLSDGSMSIKDQMNQAFDEINQKREVFRAGSKNRKARWAAMDNWMRPAPDGLPYWMVTKDCPNLIRTIPLMEPDANDIEDLNTDLEDHAVDSVSYHLPFVKWVDAKVGPVQRPQPKTYNTWKTFGLVDLGAFTRA